MYPQVCARITKHLMMDTRGCIRTSIGSIIGTYWGDQLMVKRKSWWPKNQRCCCALYTLDRAVTMWPCWCASLSHSMTHPPAFFLTNFSTSGMSECTPCCATFKYSFSPYALCTKRVGCSLTISASVLHRSLFWCCSWAVSVTQKCKGVPFEW